ncbi:unnamed protein product [Prunus armeniaca]|nr:unnamed protein product [Prunus armeniaca]
MAFVLPHLLFLLFLLLPFSVIAQTNGNISVGRTLTAGEESAWWLSPSKDFALGFQKLDNDHFLLAIWCHKIPQKTVVWYANEGNPAPRKSKVELTDQGLLLRPPQGDQQLLTEFPAAAIAYGVMNDTGNFMIVDTSFRVIWETFNHPTDTLLPTQTMEVGGLLYSRQTETNFSRGRYQFQMLGNGDAVLNPINVPGKYTYDAYYISGSRDEANDTNSGYKVIFDQSGYLYILRRSGERFFITTPGQALSPTRYYVRATLHFDGVFIISYQLKNSTTSESWSVIHTEPDNICVKIDGEIGTGPCGYNSVCTLKEDRRPSCRCPVGYSLLNPTDEYSGCKAAFLQQDCEDGGGQGSERDLYYMDELPNTDFPRADYELFTSYNVEACKTSCLEDCLCAAAVSSDNRCWKKKLPLSNGRQDSGVNGKTFLKLRSSGSLQSPTPLPPKAKNQNTLIIVGSALLGSSVFVNFILVGAICLGFFYYQKKLMGTHQDKASAGSNLRYFTYKELIEATQGFKEELGRGSCGIVYKGKADHAGGPVLAVKVLDRVFNDKEKEFKAEVKVIGQTHHKNLVRLLGYCDEGQHRLLVYEYLSSGTLASFLFGDDVKPSWQQRNHIALGIARGLVYLHEECSTQIIHCDIKPQNILLDEYYNARISDFGLAKLLNQTQASKTAIRGTKGYVAPDWFRSAPVSVKVDVYSFGVLLLEIVCCQRNVDVEVGGGERGVLTDWAYDLYMEGRLDALIENDLEAMNDMNKVERFVMVAIWCIQEDPAVRPTMKKVMLMLEGIVQVSVPPSPFPFSSIS